MGNWEENVRKVVPYVPGEQPKRANIIKLNTNENPYPPAPGVEEVLRQYQASELRKYPDASATDLVNAIAENYGVQASEVFVGVGSDDVIAMSYLTFFNGKDPILFPDITYSFYDVWAEEFRVPYVTIPLDQDFHAVLSDYDRPCGGIIIPNPNAPTGITEGRTFYEELVKRHPDQVVIIDEAYIDFGGESMLPLIHTYDNLLVVQTFSKSRSLAGSRIGFAIGNEKLIKYLMDVKYSFNSYTMDSVTIQLGRAAMEDKAYFKECVGKIIDTREWTKQELKRLGFVFGDSKTNFIFAKHPNLDAAEVFQELREEGIFVRYFPKERIKDYFRITIGRREEMETLIASLEKKVQAKSC